MNMETATATKVLAACCIATSIAVHNYSYMIYCIV